MLLKAEKAHRRSAASYRAAETRREQESYAEANVPPEDLVYWRKTRGLFKGRADERARAFAEYKQEHQGEDVQALDEYADERLAELHRERERRDFAVREARGKGRILIKRAVKQRSPGAFYFVDRAGNLREVCRKEGKRKVKCPRSRPDCKPKRPR
jgi:hypothetical protein